MSVPDDSQDLTLDEEQLLARHLNFYRALETGRWRPRTQAQEHFVRVTRGLETADTTHEKAYVKYMHLRAERRVERLSGDPIHDPADGPTEEWFRREDWYKSRGRQRGDMRDP